MQTNIRDGATTELTMTSGERQDLSVAVVNDDPIQLHLLSKALTKGGMDVHAFRDAETALGALARDVPPKLIVTDLYMPGIDGWKLCRLLRSEDYETFNEVPILVVSATFAGEEPSRIASDLGADAFLPQPVDFELFMETVRKLLRGETLAGNLRTLIVEDSLTLARILEDALVQQGYEVDTAGTYGLAMEKLGTGAYNVAIVDYHLPDGEGDALLNFFGETNSSCAVIMMTADARPELALSWMKKGAAAYVLKPFDPQYVAELCDRVRRERALLRVEDLLQERTLALRESEERYRRISEAVTDYIFTVQIADGRPIGAVHGEACYAVTGYSSQELNDDPELWFRIVTDEDRPLVRDLAASILSGGEPRPVEHRIRRKEGELRWVSNAPVPHYDGSGVLVACDHLIRDITDRKLLEEQLRQSQKMQAVGQLAGGVAHDFNNLLQVISGHVDLASRRCDCGGDVADKLAHIGEAAGRAAKLTGQLLAFGRRQVLRPERLDFNEKVAESLKMFRRIIPENVELLFAPVAGLDHVLADPVQIDQVLLNLCINARDAMPDGGRVVIAAENVVLDEEFCCGHAWAKAGEYVLLTVSDNGHGIPPEDMDHIFEPFFTTKEPGRGSGMGLAMVYGIVAQHGGCIQARSQPGEGTAFDIYLPTAGREVAAPETQSQAVARGGNETILIVEDDAMVREMVSEMLEAAGYTVLHAADGEEAIRILEERAEEIDLAMLDVIMPKMGGRQVYELIQKRWPHIPTVFSSGYAADAPHADFVLEEGLVLIHKPYRIDALLQTVREGLDSCN